MKNRSKSREPTQKLNIENSSMNGGQIGQAANNVIQTRIGTFINKSLTSMQIFLIIVGILIIIALSAFFIQRYNTNKGNSQQINISGSPVITDTQIGTSAGDLYQIKIYANDSLEVKQKKIEKAKQLIASEVLFNITNLDYRLGFVEHALLLNNTDDFNERLRKTRQQVAPAIETIASEGYQKLMSQQQASSLRTIFNSYPLRVDLEAPLIQVLVEGNINPERVNTFYNDLREVQHQSEALLETIAEPMQATTEDKNIIAYQKRKLSFAVNMLKNRSELAYLSAWVVFNSLEISIPELSNKITTLQYLKPNQILNNPEISKLRQEFLAEEIQLISERNDLVAEVKKIVDDSLDMYKDLNTSLTIQSTDTWSQVVAKAKSLRQLGRTTDAVAAFSRYEEMFADKESTAKQYAKVAQLFTMQLAALKVDGGIYIYEVLKNSIAEKAGLKIGDIIIDYNGQNINEMDNLITALRDSPKGELVKITFLRLNDNGSFIRETKTVTGGLLGIGFMPI